MDKAVKSLAFEAGGGGSKPSPRAKYKALCESTVFFVFPSKWYDRDMTIERDGTWDKVGSKLRDSLRDEYNLHGEECMYVDMVTLKDHRPVDWHDHSAVHALIVLAYGGCEQLPAWPSQLTDTPALREAIRTEFVAHAGSYDQSFEDERDVWGDRHAIVALRGINAFLSGWGATGTN